MTDKTALRQLIEAVQAGSFDAEDWWQDLRVMFPMSMQEVRAGDDESDQVAYIRAAYNGSLDAAKALHEALLPHYGWKVEGDNTAWVWWSLSNEWSGKSTTAARAWLIAILKAYEAQQ